MILTSTRDSSRLASFAEALHATVPGDGGLFVPRTLPQLNNISALLELPWHARNVLLLNTLIGDEYTQAELASVAAHAFDFSVPLVRINNSTVALELWHGPTLAFKDFGIRFLAGMLELQRPHDGQTTTILCATSGDTGAAVARGFWQREGFRVVVLYPSGRVSPLQERQFASLGDNVLALRIEGSFDDCQHIAKACFADDTLRINTRLTSANSLNIARVFAQTLYYFEGLAQLRASGDTRDPYVAVPSGNFGNVLSGLMSRAMGLPVARFVVATNVNDTVPHFLDTGEYSERRSVQTLSNAMDVGAPSNWERINHLFSGDRALMRGAMLWGAASDEDTRDAMRELAAIGYQADPHTAVGYSVLKRHASANHSGIVLSTAHPAKFAETMNTVHGTPPDLPPALAALLSQPVLAEAMPNDISAVMTRIAAHAR